MSFETSLKPILALNKLFGVFIATSDSKSFFWIFPAFVAYIYCFLENRYANLFQGEKSIMCFLRDYAITYNGLFCLVVLFAHNFIRRREITGLISKLSLLEANFGVDKHDLGVKLWWFIGGAAFLWGSDFYVISELGISVFVFLGYASPLFFHFSFGFLYSEILKITAKVFIEVNLRVTGLLRSFEKRCLVRLLEVHHQLLDICYKENQLFDIPLLACLTHCFFIYTLMYGTICKMFWEGTLFSNKGIVEAFGYYKWLWTFIGTWWYVIRSWVQITQEVSHLTNYNAKQTSLTN